ncbi:ThuA domain-containing protein [Sphingomonas aliaeris]|uniref:ThuA domain-containing protein n=2 Tax=Sphingomonas aliaeris TaxID=2759526 RepID=A0A974S5J2_9SPHN|nr:ThuA domain-containing protein [Sphingomonas aliaeris]
MIAGIALAFAMILGSSNAAASAPDCPLRDQPFSVDSPLLDLWLSPAATQILDDQAPAVFVGASDMLRNRDVPAFAAIITARMVARKKLSAEQVDRLDRSLRALPVTPSDRRARCARYDETPLNTRPVRGRPAVLVFQKIVGFRDGPSVDAAEQALRAMAKRRGWSIVVTDRGGAMTAATLSRFDTVIWNNVSGDVLTIRQRAAFRTYIENGGGFVGIHGAGGDLAYFWDWYADELIGTRFRGHPTQPSFQTARIDVADPDAAITQGLGSGWTMNDEWYSFVTNPRETKSTILLTLDEQTYSPKGGGEDISMGDHPIAWTRCVRDGRAFFSAMGHRPETYADPSHNRLLEQGILWSIGRSGRGCRAGQAIDMFRDHR